MNFNELNRLYQLSKSKESARNVLDNLTVFAYEISESGFD